MRRWIGTVLAVLVACGPSVAAEEVATPGSQSKASEPEARLFCIGEPDRTASEFGITRYFGRDYLRVFPRPIVYTVGKSGPAAWPYVHPSTRDKWAGSRRHTFTIRFNSEKDITRPFFLILGLADAHSTEPSQVTVVVNDQVLNAQRAPKGTGLLAYDPYRPGRPSAMVFQIPDGLIKQGPNTIAISLKDGSWIIYDYVLLSTGSTPPDVKSKGGNLLEKALTGPLADVEDIIFAARKLGGDGHWYANFGYYDRDANRMTYGEGGRLCRLNVRTGKLKVLLDDPKGGVRDPQVHYDGKKILLSYRKGGTRYYNLYEINTDGTGLRQLTDGPFDDIEPTYLPDGDIMFCSSRCNRWVNCWHTHVAVLYRCDPNGRNIRMISSNNEHDNTPWMLPDGRVLYTRWEYVDRSQVQFHHLWTINPDGTGQMTYYGNLHPGTVMIDAKPIPGTQSIVASFSPGHGRREHDGVITIVNPNGGPDRTSFARRISPGAPAFRDPFPLSQSCFLVARGAALLLMDDNGAMQVIHELPDDDVRAGFQCHEPRPLCPHRRELCIPQRVNPTKETGQLILVDINCGRKMDGVKRGEIKKLLVLETLPKPINFSGGMEPLSCGGTFTLERILGTVPVEQDGSAYMELPALRSLFFVALDENDLSVKRMQSFVTVQPGETTSCAGCHEERSLAPPITSALIAMRRPPTTIKPIPEVPDVFDFPRDIQPILDKHCLKCHDYDKRSGGVILSGDRGPWFSHSYVMLTARNQVSDGRNGQGNRPPRSIGSAASPLMKKIDGSHNGVKVSEHERDMIRLWIDSGAAYPGTYASLGTGMVGGSLNALPGTKAAMAVMKRRCAGCHQPGTARQLPMSAAHDLDRPWWRGLSGKGGRYRFTRHTLYNLSRPEKSMLLLAPLARKAGGYGMCDRKTGKVIEVFADTNDPDYQTLLASVREAKKELDTIKRFDMAGFRPNPHYVREMKRYGILPLDLASDAAVDVYAAERKYWKSLWYQAAARADHTPVGN